MLQIVYPSIYKKVVKYSTNIEKHFNANNKIIHFSPRDKVMLKNLSVNSKTDPKSLSPFIIHHCTNKGAYILQDITGNILFDKVPPSALDSPPSNHYYLMKWKGYPDSDNSWVAAKDFGSQQPIITYWGKKYPKKRCKWR